MFIGDSVHLSLFITMVESRAVRIGSTAVQPVSAVRDLGIMLDAGVTMSTHVSAVVKGSFAALRRTRSVRRSIPRRTLLTLIQALVVSMVDCRLDTILLHMVWL